MSPGITGTVMKVKCQLKADPGDPCCCSVTKWFLTLCNSMNCSTPASLSCTISQMWNLAGLMLEFQQILQRVPGEVAGLSQELGAAADVMAGTQSSRGEGGGCHRVTKDPEPMRYTLNTPKKRGGGIDKENLDRALEFLRFRQRDESGK